MTPIEQDGADYELWLRVHNYAGTTISGRHRYLGYFFAFAADAAASSPASGHVGAAVGLPARPVPAP